MILKKCEWCGKLFVRKHSASKYCSDYCRRQGNLESKRNKQREYNKRKVWNTKIKNIVALGSKNTSLGSKANPNFKIEQELIDNQIRILKI